MNPPSDFKVIISGGGIAGLTLANILEKFDLDYVILEAYSAIAPPVGASVGMFPNGLRILDQIGCYQAIKDLFGAGIPYNKSLTRDNNGKIISAVNGIFDHLEKRYGYGLFFFDRQKLLQILYDQINRKDRVLLQKKVTGVNLIDGGVDVTCADGSTFTGTLLVGADGIHSAVRASMTALGNKFQPGYFDPIEQDRVPCYYSCSFGIAQHVPGWVSGEQNMVTGKGRSQLVVSGPEGRVYWFMFEKLPETKYGRDIPSFSKEEEIKFVKRNFNVPITENVTFGQVFTKRISSTLTPLHEVVYKKWFFKRIITLGDSAHKPNPIGGQGANGAIESCAEFVNALLRKKDSRDGSLTGLTEQDIEDIFRETQAARHERAELIVRRSHEVQSLFAYRHPVTSAIVYKFVQPLMGDEAVLNKMGSVFVGGAALEKLPVPQRPRAIPFCDELPAKPINKDISKTIRNILVGGMGLVLFATTKGFRLPFSDLSRQAEASVVIRWFSKSAASDFLNMLVSVLAVPILDKDPSARLHLLNFLSQLISPLLVYTIEGYRAGHEGTPLSWPSLFSAGMQAQGIGRMAPLHAILSSFLTHESPTGRFISPEVVRSLIPAITIGYVIPTVMVFAPSPNVKAWQNWVAIWQFAPVLFSMLARIFSIGLQKRKHGYQSPNKSEEELRFDRYETHDVPLLKSVYTYAFAVQATAHIASLAYAWHHPAISIRNTFFGLPNLLGADWSLPSLEAKLAVFFKYDMLFAVAGIFGGNLYSIWDLRRLGNIKTKEAVKAALSVVAGQFLVGSGATWAGLWYWREGKIASLSRAGGNTEGALDL
ncbi:hypothetical protein DL770_010584 [Monosporascus sp. CRB-9-2]|nr:hypothetical protein DL770_010584 [Monosporascus sp. CRB-9-2]